MNAPVHLDPASDAWSMPLDSIDVSNPNGQAIRAVVSITGRVRNCAPNGEFKQMPKC